MQAMSSPEPVVASRRLRSAAEAERDRLTREVERLDARAEALRRELATVDARREELREQLALLARIAWEPDAAVFATRKTADRATHLKAVDDDFPPAKTMLRGARIRETAVLLLASSANPTRPIHYQQWYRILREAGYGIDARDPEATFLTQMTRSPVVRRANAPGVYALDFEAPRLIRQRMRALEEKLATTALRDERAEDFARSRSERAKIVQMLRATERQLEEALRSLGNPTNAEPANESD